jgi:hypothetical protein
MQGLIPEKYSFYESELKNKKVCGMMVENYGRR